MKDRGMFRSASARIERGALGLKQNLFLECHILLSYHERVQERGRFSRYFGQRITSIVIRVSDAIYSEMV